MIGIFVGICVSGLLILIIWLIYAVKKRFSVIIHLPGLKKKDQEKLIKIIKEMKPKEKK